MSAYVYTPVERVSRRLGLFLLFVIGVLLMVALFYVKTRAQAAHDDVTRLERDISEQERAIAVLTAERAVLTNPDRVASLAEERLGLETIKVENTRTPEALHQGGEDEK